MSKWTSIKTFNTSLSTGTIYFLSQNQNEGMRRGFWITLMHVWQIDSLLQALSTWVRRKMQLRSKRKISRVRERETWQWEHIVSRHNDNENSIFAIHFNHIVGVASFIIMIIISFVVCSTQIPRARRFLHPEQCNKSTDRWRFDFIYFCIFVCTN